MPLSLNRLERTVPLIEGEKPSYHFQRYIDELCKNIENSFNSLETIVLAIAAAQATATAAVRETARINSYPNPGTIVSAADVGTDCDIVIANHTRVYPVQGSVDVPDVAITGDTIHGLAFTTQYWIYYDDTTLADTTPTFQATTVSATAQVGAAAGRHLVGFVTTPADGGAPAPGGGGGTPGGGGGFGGGGQIP